MGLLKNDVQHKNCIFCHKIFDCSLTVVICLKALSWKWEFIVEFTVQRQKGSRIAFDIQISL